MKTKFLKKLMLLIVMFAVMVSVLSACSLFNSLVTFDTNGGSSVDSQTVASGTVAIMPEEPTKDGYIFVGWTDVSGVTFDFETKIYSDTTIYASWAVDPSSVVTYYTVSFDTDGGDSVASQEVADGESAVMPATDPTKTGYEFGGWVDGDGRTFDFSQSINGDTIIYAQWTALTYTVSFEDGSGTTLSSQTIEYSNTVIQPNNPTTSGYSFDNWVDADGNIFDFSTAITGDITLYATWKDLEIGVEYTVSFDSMGGSSVLAQIIEQNACASLPTPAPSYEGYSFGGWVDGSGNAYDFSAAVTGDITLYATWNINSYTVTFSTGSGGSSVTSQSVEYGAAASEPETDPTRSGYVFAVWVDSSGAAFDFETAITADTTIYAKWTAEYLVNFDTDGGSDIDSQIILSGESVSEPATPTKDGYSFGGWVSDDGIVFDFSAAITENTTIYATWNILSYTVSFDDGSGSTLSSQSVKYNETASEPETDPTRDGYIFASWVDSSGAAFDFENAEITGDITLYATWNINSYSVTFSTGSGGSSVTSQSVEYNETASEPETDPTRDGYIFASWVDSSGAAFDFETAITADTTIYAKWTAEYLVSFDDGDGTILSSQTVLSDEFASAPSETPTKDGYSFGGWVSDDGIVFDFSAAITENTTIYATWNILSYTVSFDDGSGTIISTQSVEYNSAASEPTTPTISGYMFVSWVDADGNAFSFDMAITSDIIVYATWEENEADVYEVSFDTMGGSSVATQYIVEDAFASLPTPAPTKDGYSFGGWVDGSGNAYDFSAAVTGDITLYATWNINSYTVSFSTGTGGSSVTSQTVEYGAAASEPATNPTRDGYVFSGWVDGSGVAFDFETAITSDTTIYAKWTAEYLVNFDTDGGSDIDSQIVLSGEFASEPATPTKDGYSFGGWVSDDGIVFDFSAAITENTTIYATWNILSYTVSFDDGSGTIISTQTIKYNSVASEPTTPAKDGYSFGGWVDSSDAAFDFKNTEITGDITLYATWNINSYTVTFSTGTGGSSVDSQTVKYNETASEPATNPTRSGYVFSGWYDGSGAAFDFDTAITSDTTIYAKWTAQYTVAFVTYGGSSVSSQVVLSGECACEPSTTPTKTGYIFADWVSSDGIVFDFSVAITENTIIYATYTEITYTVTFGDGLGSTLSTQTVAYGGTVVVPNDPTRSGYTFVSWVLIDGTTYNFATAVTSDVNIYATWTKVVEYTVTFYSYGGSSVASQIIVKNSYASEPSPAPTKTGYDFMGWVDSSGEAFDFENTPITSNITIYASWENQTYTITFSTGSGGSSVSNQYVVYGGKATKPSVSPTREGYIFYGWVDADGNAFDFTTTITADTTIYASWTSYASSLSTYHEGSEVPDITLVIGTQTVLWVADYAIMSPDVSVYSGYYILDGVSYYLELTLTVTAHEAASEYVVTKEATCDEEGIMTLYCTICGEALSVISIPALGHSYTITVYTEGDCCNYGYTEYVCSICGSYMMDPDDPTQTYKVYDTEYGDCVYGTEVVEVTAPTCSTTGIGYVTCTICGAIKYVTIEKLECDYSVEVVYDEGDCCTLQTMALACSYCGSLMLDEYGNVYTYEGTEYGECNYVDGFCTICGAMAPSDYSYDISATEYDDVWIYIYSDGAYYNAIIVGTGDIAEDWKDSISTTMLSRIQKVTIKDGVTSIPEYFMGDGKFASLEYVVFDNDDITTIPSYAFAKCSALIEVTYPFELVSVQSYAFNGCEYLEWSYFPSTLEWVGDYAYGGPGTEEMVDFYFVDLSNTVVHTLGDYAFYTGAINYVILPSTIETKGTMSFYEDHIYNIYGDLPIIILGDYDENLTYNYRSTEYFLGSGSSVDNITFWENGSLTFTTENAFYARINQNGVTGGTNSQQYYIDTFADGGSVVIYTPYYLTESEVQWILDLGEQDGYMDVVMISGEACAFNYNLTSITLPDSVEVLGHGAFVRAYAGYLDEFIIGEDSKLHDIGDYALYGTNISELRLPSQLSTIGYLSFYYMPLSTLYYDAQALAYQPTFNYNPDSGDPYDTTGRNMFDSSTSLINYISSTSLDIYFGSTVEVIYEFMLFLYYGGGSLNGYYSEQSLIKTLDFTNATSLHTIGYSAFMGNIAVTEIDLSNTQFNYYVEGGSYTFGYMTGLEVIKLPEITNMEFQNTALTSYYACVFQGCTNIKEIHITGNITAKDNFIDEAGVGIFSGIGSVVSPVTVYIYPEVTSLPANLLNGLNKNYLNIVLMSGSELTIGSDGVYYGDTLVIDATSSTVMSITKE